MKIYKKFILISLLLLSTFYIGCSNENNPKNLKIDSSKISSVTIFTLPTPPKYKIIDKQEDIKKIINFINNINLLPTEEDSTKGWQVKLDLSGLENHSITFSSDKLNIDGTFYKIDSSKVTDLKTLYKTLDYTELLNT